MTHNSTPVRLHRRGTAGHCGFVMPLVLAVAMASAAHAGNIFDDDWAPPPRDATHPATAPPAPAPPAPAEPTRPEVAPPPVAVPPPPQESNPPAPAPNPAQAGRHAVPAKADLDRSRTLLKEAFAAQMVDRTVQARHKLAESLSTR